jgi:hypothetical protein
MGSQRVSFDPHSSGDWVVWRDRVPGHQYYMGVDAARGLQLEAGDIEPTPEGDFAAAAIVDADEDEFVARMNKRINPEILAAKIDAAGRYYNDAMINIELTGNLGLWAQKVLRDYLLYPNIYRWRGTRDDKISDMNKYYKRTVLGFEMGQRTREMIFDAFRAGIRSHRIKLYDKILVAQMENATRQEGFRWEVIRNHDDVLVAYLLAWFAREQWGPVGKLILGHKQLLEQVEKAADLTWVDDHAMSLARHYHKIQQYSLKRYSNDTKRLEGI